MAGARAASIFPATCRNFTGEVQFFNGSLGFSDMIFGFLDENYPISQNLNSDDSFEDRGLLENDDEKSFSGSGDEKTFWDEQEKLLEAIICRTTSRESRIRQVIKEGMREIMTPEGHHCVCRSSAAAAGGCRSCLRREICDHLCKAGYNCSISKSKWKSSHKIPSGEHTYLEVTEKSSSTKGETKVVIELNFRAEFEVARASSEYNRLIEQLPDVYVGKPVRLKKLIKILCGAAKKCMKENNMHMAPWRKPQYMQAKWLGTCQMVAGPPPSVEQFSSHRLAKPRASMLTLSLSAKTPSESHRQAVKVV